MEYRFTDTMKTTVTFDLTVSQIEDLRGMLTKLAKAEIEGVSKWRVREMVRKLADAQRQAGEIMMIDAKALIEAAKKDDEL